MARPKKKPPRNDGMYEVKKTVGRDMSGKPIRKSFYSSVSLADAKRKAEEYFIEQKASEITGTVFAPNSTRFDEWSRRWLEVYKKPNVDESTYQLTYVNTVEKHLIPYFRDADLRIIQPINIQEFFSAKSSCSESLLSKIHMCLTAIFDAAIENDLCYKNPVKSKSITYASTRTRNEKKVLTSEQIVLVCAQTKMPEITALLHTGMRRGELCGLMWSDVDLEKRTIKISRSIALTNGVGIKTNPPKWNSYRMIPIDDTMLAQLKGLYSTRTSLYVYPNKHGSAQNPSTFAHNLERHMKQLPPDIPRLTAHEMRHTYGTELRRRGVDIYTIQKVMGHRDIKMTSELYVHNEIEELKKAMGIG